MRREHDVDRPVPEVEPIGDQADLGKGPHRGRRRATAPGRVAEAITSATRRAQSRKPPWYSHGVSNGVVAHSQASVATEATGAQEPDAYPIGEQGEPAPTSSD